MLAEDHLVQAWECLAVALRGGEKADANMMIARRRLACAQGLGHAVKRNKVKAYEAECASLAAALA